MKSIIVKSIAIAIVSASLSGCIDKEAKAEESSAPEVNLPSKVKMGEEFEYNDKIYSLRQSNAFIGTPVTWEPYTHLLFDTYDPYTGKQDMFSCYGSTTFKLANFALTPVKDPLCQHFNINDRFKRKDFPVEDIPEPTVIDKDTTWVPNKPKEEHRNVFYYKGRKLVFAPMIDSGFVYPKYVELQDNKEYFLRRIYEKEIEVSKNDVRGETKVRPEKLGLIKGVEATDRGPDKTSSKPNWLGNNEELIEPFDATPPADAKAIKLYDNSTDYHWKTTVKTAVYDKQDNTKVRCYFDGKVSDEAYPENDKMPKFVDEPVSSEFCNLVIESIFN